MNGGPAGPSFADLNDGTIRGGVLQDFTFGVNWYHNYNLRIQWNYVLSHREVDAPRGSGDTHGFVMRFSFDI
jgi:phosphate-selective porin